MAWRPWAGCFLEPRASLGLAALDIRSLHGTSMGTRVLPPAWLSLAGGGREGEGARPEGLTPPRRAPVIQLGIF